MLHCFLPSFVSRTRLVFRPALFAMSRRSTRVQARAIAQTNVPTPKLDETVMYDSPLSELEDEPPAKKPKTRKDRKKVQSTTTSKDVYGGPKPRKAATASIDDAEFDGDATTRPPKQARKPRAPKPEPVYIIPDVEKRQTTYSGRLGYACLNTILRAQKPPVFCSRTCRIDTIKQKGMSVVQELGLQNAKDLLELIKWNEENNIRFLRVSSEIFPFASHPVYGYKLASLPGVPEALKEAGDLAKQHGHRLTTHPGQFTQLGSPREAVVAQSLKELQYHAEMLDLMGVGPDGVMIIHGGGVYGDKEETLQRLKEYLARLDPDDESVGSVRRRLVLENDELCYSAADLLPICEELDIPLVFDYHHHSLNPGDMEVRDIVDRASAIFRRRGIKPKQHLSEPRPGAETIMELRAHSDRCQTLPDELADDMDLMIEAKDKEQAVLHLHRIYDLQPIIHASLRPANENPSKQTNGRKSNKKAKALKQAQDDVLEQVDDAAAEGEIAFPWTRRSTRQQTGILAKEEACEISTEAEVTNEDASPTKKRKRGRKMKGAPGVLDTNGDEEMNEDREEALTREGLAIETTLPLARNDAVLEKLEEQEHTLVADGARKEISERFT